MALFKSLRGKRENLPSVKTDGYAYFCTDDGSFFIDYKDANGNLQRKQLNAYSAETFGKLTTVSLLASQWVGTQSPYSQVVSVNGVEVNSKVDLQPSAVQLAELQSAGTVLMTENDGGVVTVYALNNKPIKDYTIQALLSNIKEVDS